MFLMDQEKGERWPIILVVAGMVVLIYGLISLLRVEQPTVEVLSVEKAVVKGTIWADIGGAVNQPGVYELENGARVGELIARAGGLTGQADELWVTKNINLSQKIADEYKIYIPFSGEGILGETAEGKKVNLNTATEEELESLSGIGGVRAKEIIAGRPYARTEELKDKKILPESVWEKIKDQLSVY